MQPGELIYYPIFGIAFYSGLRLWLPTACGGAWRSAIEGYAASRCPLSNLDQLPLLLHDWCAAKEQLPMTV
jgi:hypothetical protein